MALTTGSSAAAGINNCAVSAVKTFGTGISNATIPAALPATNIAFTSVGAGAGAFNTGSVSVRTVVNGTPDLVDLTSTLTAPDGSTCDFADILALIITNPAASTGNLIIGGAASNPWAALLGTAGTITLLPGMSFAIMGAPAAGYAVSGTSKVLEIASSAGTINYTIMAVGH